MSGGVKRQSHWVRMDDSLHVHVRTWEGELAPPRAVLQLAHGMAEHIERYDAFASYVAERGIHVIGNDHRGHGRTGEATGSLGHFANSDGFDRVTDDCRAITRWISTRHPDLPVFLMGHSMGSMIVRRYIQRYTDGVAGVVIMGTAGDPGRLLVRLGQWLARREIRRKGPRQPSPLLHRISSRAPNKRVETPKTPFDWLSRDESEVAKYVADPLCGFVMSAGFYLDLLTGVQVIHDDALIRNIPKELPMLFVSGDADPVGDYGAGVRQVISQYERHGLQRIESVMYEGGRHEPLNDTNKDDVYAAIYEWLQARLTELAAGSDRAGAGRAAAQR